ncbi:MAG: amino acid permease, partial [marine benthic group bacterium]|nr:amino acid permease [Gemmatimonadota bacterium]
APGTLSLVEDRTRSPRRAVFAVGAGIAAIALIGDVRITWSFSAFTVLVYYALTNLAALRLPSDARLFSRWISWAGLVGCLSLAFWVESGALIAGVALLVAGFVARRLFRREIEAP